LACCLGDGKHTTTCLNTEDAQSAITGSRVGRRGAAMITTCAVLLVGSMENRGSLAQYLPHSSAGVDPVYYIYPREQALLEVPVAITFRDHASLVSSFLGLGKTDVARILGVSRPTLYSWISGESEPQEGYSSHLLERLGRIIAPFAIATKRPLYHRFVEHPLPGRNKSLREVLMSKSWDDLLITDMVAQARELTDQRDKDLGISRGARSGARGGNHNLQDNLIASDLL
jgi:hypothetical protein